MVVATMSKTAALVMTLTMHHRDGVENVVRLRLRQGGHVIFVVETNAGGIVLEEGMASMAMGGVDADLLPTMVGVGAIIILLGIHIAGDLPLLIIIIGVISTEGDRCHPPESIIMVVLQVRGAMAGAGGDGMMDRVEEVVVDMTIAMVVVGEDAMIEIIGMEVEEEIMWIDGMSEGGRTCTDESGTVGGVKRLR
jgi:hypothetical protein